DGSKDPLVSPGRSKPVNERLVDLDERQRQAPEVGQRGVPGAEVVEADLDPGVQNLTHLVEDVGVEVEDGGLGELEVQALRRQTGLLETLAHELGQIAGEE